MDRQASQLEPRLGVEAMAHPGVRALLGLGAARLGDVEHALKLAAGIDGPPAAEIHAALAEETGLSKKEIASVFDELGDLLEKNLGKRGPGVFNLPGLLKVKVVRKPATKARMGINPFTKEETMFKAKPARNVVKILPLKGLKDMV